MPYKYAFYLIGAVLVIQVIAMFVGIYERFPSFDIPMHLSGGFAMGMLGLAIHHHMTSSTHNHGHVLHHLLFVLGFTMLVAVAWEFHEYLIDETVGKWNGWGKQQLSLSDTMGDLLFGGVGSLLAFGFFRRRV
ncbi:MAG: hypothetical protein AAB337_01630 [Patescibacteria group bacterium]